MRRPVSDPREMFQAIAARVNTTERDIAALREDVAGLGRGLADTIAQLRGVPKGRTARPAPAPGDAATTDADADEPATADPVDDSPVDEEAEEGQPDWLAVTDHQQAHDLLVVANEWAARVSAWYGLDLPGIPCWPLHPPVVGDLLALAAQREHAHAQPDPTAVMEWLTRWFPAGINRIRTELAACRRDAAHVQGGRLFEPTDLTTPEGLDDVALWWTTARHIPAAQWLELPPRS